VRRAQVTLVAVEAAVAAAGLALVLVVKGVFEAFSVVAAVVRFAQSLMLRFDKNFNRLLVLLASFLLKKRNLIKQFWTKQ